MVLLWSKRISYHAAMLRHWSQRHSAKIIRVYRIGITTPQLCTLQASISLSPGAQSISTSKGTHSLPAALISLLTRSLASISSSCGASTRKASWIIITMPAFMFRRWKIRSSRNIAVLIRSASICWGHVTLKLLSKTFLGRDLGSVYSVLVDFKGMCYQFRTSL